MVWLWRCYGFPERANGSTSLYTDRIKNRNNQQGSRAHGDGHIHSGGIHVSCAAAHFGVWASLTEFNQRKRSLFFLSLDPFCFPCMRILFFHLLDSYFLALWVRGFPDDIMTTLRQSHITLDRETIWPGRWFGALLFFCLILSPFSLGLLIYLSIYVTIICLYSTSLDLFPWFAVCLSFLLPQKLEYNRGFFQRSKFLHFFCVKPLKCRWSKPATHPHKRCTILQKFKQQHIA